MRVDIGDGVRLFVDIVGAGLEPTPDAMVTKPTLMLLHGGPGFDHSSFRPYFDRFADTHQVVYFDHRGQGRSDRRGDPRAGTSTPGPTTSCGSPTRSASSTRWCWAPRSAASSRSGTPRAIRITRRS